MEIDHKIFSMVILFVEIDHKIFSMVILSPPLIEEGQIQALFFNQKVSIFFLYLDENMLWVLIRSA